MAKRKGLPKKYAKMGFKRGWAAYKRSGRSPARRTYTTPVRRRRSRPMAKRKTYRRSSKGKILTKPFYDGLISAGGKIALRRLGIQHQLLDAGIDGAVGFIRNNKTLQAQAVVEGITVLIPNLSGGSNGSIIGGWEE